MTTLQDKTPEELTRMLAECLGWQRLPTEEGWSRAVSESHMLRPDGLNVASPPPYATSYDAIMPVVSGLSDEEFERFEIILGDLSGHPACSLARQRARITASPADLTRALILVLQSK